MTQYCRRVVTSSSRRLVPLARWLSLDVQFARMITSPPSFNSYCRFFSATDDTNLVNWESFRWFAEVRAAFRRARAHDTAAVWDAFEVISDQSSRSSSRSRCPNRSITIDDTGHNQLVFWTIAMGTLKIQSSEFSSCNMMVHTRPVCSPLVSYLIP